MLYIILVIQFIVIVELILSNLRKNLRITELYNEVHKNDKWNTVQGAWKL